MKRLLASYPGPSHAREPGNEAEATMHPEGWLYSCKKLWLHGLSGLESVYEAFAITVHVATEGLYCLLLLASSLAYVECLDNDIHEVTTRLLETCGEGEGGTIWLLT